MNNFKTTLELSKETKNTYVFKNETPNAPLPSLYIKKGTFLNGVPKTIEVSVREMQS